MLQFIPPTLLFSSLLQLLLALYAWSRRKDQAARPLAVTFLIGSVWAFTYSMDLASSDLATKTLWMLVRLSFNRFIAFSTWWIAVEHLELWSRYRKFLPALLAIPVASLFFMWTGDYHHLYRHDYYLREIGGITILGWTNGPLYWVSYFFDVGLYASALYMMLRSFPGISAVKKSQTGLIMLGLFAPLVTDIAYTFGISPIPGFNFTPYFLVFSEALLAYSIFHYGWLRIAPVARSLVVDILPGGMVAIDAKQRIVDLNRYAEEKFGALSHNAIGKDARELLAAIGISALPEKISSPVKNESSITDASGKTCYLDIDILPLKNDSGQFRGWLVYFADISARKETELRLLQLTHAVEQSPTSIIITDLSGHITYANPKFSSLTGYAIEEVLGKNPNIIQSGQTPDETYKGMWETIENGQTWSGEFLNKKKNGELYWEMAVIAPVIDAGGQMTSFIAVKEDITQRKQATQALQDANQQMAQQLEEIQKLQATLREQAIRDPLTHLHNRRFLNESAGQQFQYAERHSLNLSLIMLDIDRFKSINDTYGHQAGDVCLVELAQLLQQSVRKSDIVCRYGGEEFVLLLFNASVADAAALAEKIRATFEQTTIQMEGQTIHATVSLGVAGYPGHGTTPREIIQKADEALYASKNGGRNRVTVWSDKSSALMVNSFP